MHEKNNHYKELMIRMDKAHQHKFYLEACWFAYTVLEDRLLSALRQSGGPTNAKNSPIQMLGNKIKEIHHRNQNDELLKAYFDDSLMNRIHQWKEDRNDLTHAMADGTKTMNEVDKTAYLLSTNAKTLVADVCAAARRLKKHREKG